MSKTLEALKSSRPWIRHIDDERGDGSSIIVTLAKGYDFADDPGCGVKGFDTVAEVRDGTHKADVVSIQYDDDLDMHPGARISDQISSPEIAL